MIHLAVAAVDLKTRVVDVVRAVSADRRTRNLGGTPDPGLVGIAEIGIAEVDAAKIGVSFLLPAIVEMLAGDAVERLARGRRAVFHVGVDEEEDLVLHDRAAAAEAVLAFLELAGLTEGVWANEVLVAGVVEHRAREVLGTAAGDGVDAAARKAAVLDVEVGLHVEPHEDFVSCVWKLLSAALTV